MTEQEFQGWWNYYQSDPWGEDRADLRSGIVASILANANSAKGRRFKAKDFLLYPPPLDPETKLKIDLINAKRFAKATQAQFKGRT